ncbi:MAG: hypothetical protein AABY79_10845, partial [Nitrospirota bacterium]
MQFTLFNRISFEITYPIALIEAVCIQHNFYRTYDLVENRTIRLANKIGARGFPLQEAQGVIDKYNNLSLLNCGNIDKLWLKRPEERKAYIKEFANTAINALCRINSICLTKATKIYHTLYPQIIPMIDNQLQEKYKEILKSENRDFSISQLFIDFYQTLYDNKENIDKIHNVISQNNIGLSKVRVFDIIWWSCLKY